VTIISAIAELERSLVADRAKSGMRRAKLEGRQIGRSRLDVNREQVVQDRRSGMSLTQVAKRHNISRASVCRLMKGANDDCNLDCNFEWGTWARCSALKTTRKLGANDANR
jgi:DNA invertase Pin-like site-specific DNA recombinase